MDAIADKLKGTWQTVETHYNFNGSIDHQITSTVTFTASRFIQFTEIDYDDGYDIPYLSYSDYGTWLILDESSIVKVTRPCCGIQSDMMFYKTLKFVEDDRLFMAVWRHDHTSELAAYHRVVDPIGELRGTWRSSTKWTNSDGFLVITELTYTIEDSFHWHQSWTLEGESQPYSEVSFSGRWWDDTDEGFIHVTATSSSLASLVGPGTEYRFGYAPTADNTRTMLWSDMMYEHIYDSETGVWSSETSLVYPYGLYRLVMRQ